MSALDNLENILCLLLNGAKQGDPEPPFYREGNVEAYRIALTLVRLEKAKAANPLPAGS